MMISVYADESCKDCHKFLILGGICADNRDLDLIHNKLQSVRNSHDTFGEVKWTKISKAKFSFYVDYIDVFFELCSQDIMHFHYLSIDTSTFDHRIHNKGNSELGFDKLIYQLLLHKFGIKYGATNKIHVYLDERTTKSQPDSMTTMLNAKLANSHNIKSSPFRRVTFQESKTSEILQLNDLIIGAIGFRKNKRHLLTESASHKKEFAEMTLRKAVELEQPIKFNSKEAKKFTSWDFKFNK